jgi:hypothetical protein
MSKDIVAKAKEHVAGMDDYSAELLIDELIEEVEALRRAITRINQIVVANMPSSG